MSNHPYGSKGYAASLQLSESLCKVSDQVLGVLDPYGHAEEVVRVPPLLLLLFAIVNPHGPSEMVEQGVDAA